MEVKKISDNDSVWIKKLFTERWGSSKIITRGNIHIGDKLPGFSVYESGEPKGLITYKLSNEECEIVSLDSLESCKGIGTNLIHTIIQYAKEKHCRRVWLITTNDNTYALRFYQKLGFELVAVYRNAFEKSREIKPCIPLFGIDNIPIKDEIELEIRFF